MATVPLGASAVPINWHWRGEEVSHVLGDSRAKALIVHDDLWPEVADAVPDEVDGRARAGAEDGRRARAVDQRSEARELAATGSPRTSPGHRRPRRAP